MTLPATETTETTEAPTPRAPDAKPAVLYIDDDPHVAKVMSRMIGKCGFVVTVVNDAAQAVRDLQEGLHHPALVLTDLEMPHMSGYQVALAVRRHRPGVPVVLITGALGDDDVEGREAVTEVLLKPCRMKEISRILHGVLG